MAGKLINNIRYVRLMDPNSYKSKSLEDNIYFTLRDVFWNGDAQQCETANRFNNLLANGVSFDLRDKDFKYSNVLYDWNSNVAQNLYDWMYNMSRDEEHSKDGMFQFSELNKDDNEDDDEEIIEMYMKYDDWWEQFLDLRSKLRELITLLKNKTLDSL